MGDDEEDHRRVKSKSHDEGLLEALPLFNTFLAFAKRDFVTRTSRSFPISR